MFKKGDRVIDTRNNKVGTCIEYDRFGQFAVVLFDGETEEKPVSSEYIRLTKLQKITTENKYDNAKEEFDNYV